MPSVRMLDASIATYTFAISQVNPQAAQTDWLEFKGASGKTIKLRYVEVGGSAAAARQQPVGLMKRSSPDLTGTFTTPTPVAVDSGDAAASCVVKQYSANPGTLGTLVGQVDGGGFQLLVNNTASATDRLVLNYEQGYMKPPQLNNANESLAVNFNVGAPIATIATDKLDCNAWWTEQ